MSRRPSPARSPLRDALHAEWTKLRTVAGPAWLLLAAAASTVAVSAASAAAVTHSPGGGQDPTRIALTGVQVGQALVAVLAVVAIGGEYSTRMIGATLTAVPSRTTVLFAKATTVAAAVLAAGLVGVLGSVLAGRLLLPAGGFTPEHGYAPLSLAAGPTLRAAAGSVLYLVLVALLSLGVATAVRDGAAAVGVVLGLLYLFPVTAGLVADPDWERRLRQVSPMEAGLAVQSTVALPDLPVSPWGGVAVLAAWTAAALLSGGLLFHLRDA